MITSTFEEETMLRLLEVLKLEKEKQLKPPGKFKLGQSSRINNRQSHKKINESNLKYRS